jgi:hypothetical protein
MVRASWAVRTAPTERLLGTAAHDTQMVEGGPAIPTFVTAVA